jgi:hypothetical protein
MQNDYINHLKVKIKELLSLKELIIQIDLLKLLNNVFHLFKVHYKIFKLYKRIKINNDFTNKRNPL